MQQDPYAHLELARAAGAIILANEGRHGRPDKWHTVGDKDTVPDYCCEPHEYVAVLSQNGMRALPQHAPALVAELSALATRAIPFLEEVGAEFDDDGSNEPLELARSIRGALE